MFKSALRAAGSLNVAVFLLALLAVVCGWATFVELDFGTPAAQQLVYRTSWFYALGLALGLNVLFAMLGRWPWRLAHLPFLIAHLGVLLLLIGAWLTHTRSLEGEMRIFEGAVCDRAVRSDVWTLRVVLDRFEDAAVKRQTITIPFSGGVFDRTTCSPALWYERVTAPALAKLGEPSGFWDRVGRAALRAHYGLVRWAAVVSGKGRNGVLYENDGLKIERIEYLCPGVFPSEGADDAEPIAGPFQKETANEFYAKAKFRVSFDGKESEFWLRTIPFGTEHADSLTRKVGGDRRTAAFSIENAQFDPEFALHVKKFEARYEPGSTTPASFSSLVCRVETGNGEKSATASSGSASTSGEADVLIRMNQPGVFRSSKSGRTFRVYQSSFSGPFCPGSAEFESVTAGKCLDGENAPREEIYQTVLTLNSDSGRGLKYGGSLMIVFGTLLLIRRKSVSLFRTAESDSETLSEIASNERLGDRDPSALPRIPAVFAWRRAAVIFGLVLTVGACLTAAASRIGDPSWNAWRQLPVWSGGRVMPLESFARQRVQEICGGLAPTISPNAEILTELKNGRFHPLPTLEELRSGRELSAEEETRLTEWLVEQKKEQTAQIERVVRRVGELFPNARPRRFEAHELIFAWIIEPDVWRFLPFLTNLNAPVGLNQPFLAPIQIESSEKFARRIDTIQNGEQQLYPDRRTAKAEGKIDRACAALEKNLSLWRALTFWPGPEVSPMTGFYLDELLYGGSTGEKSLLEELEFSTRQLQRLRKTPEMAEKPTPFDDPAFELNQTVAVGEAPRTSEVLALLRKIHLLSNLYRRTPYDMNAKLFASLADDLHRAEKTLAEHRDAVFALNEGSADYRRALLQTTWLLGQVRQKIAAASVALTQTGSYRLTTLADRKRLVPNDADVARWSGAPAASLSISEQGSLDLFPFADTFHASPNGAPWAALSTILFSRGKLAESFFGSRFGSSGESADDEAADETTDETTGETAETFLGALAQIGRTNETAEYFSAAAEQYLAVPSDRNVSAFVASLEGFAASLRSECPAVNRSKLLAESRYDRLDSVRWLWIFSLAAAFAAAFSRLAALSSGRSAAACYAERVSCVAAVGLLTAAFTVSGAGIALRAYIAGWAPVTNMFETVVALAFLILLGTLGRVFWPNVSERFDGFLKSRGAIGLGALAAAVIGILAYVNTSEFNPAIRPPVAVLRSNFWLAVHVTAIIASYALGVFAWGVSLLMLSAYLFGKYPSSGRFGDPAASVRLAPTLLALLRWTVLLLTLGTFLGAYWADCSWGRFWGWDPKEVWALVTLLIYLAILHVRAAGRMKRIGLALGGVLGALAIIMTWYGLSFVFGGGGRHAYTAGETNKTLILCLLAGANLTLGLAALIRCAVSKK